MLDLADRNITAVLGPTNTGKTHYALERMLARESGIIGLPLRLLAREIYDKLVKLRGPNAISLITGEEKIVPARAKYHVATVEAMPLHEPVDFIAIDEVQLCADPDRGHIFTDRLLHARGHWETLFLGSDTIRPRIANLVPDARFQSRQRFSTLRWTGARKISRLKPRTAVVAFSADQVYAIAELIRRQRGGAAVVMGALSPRTRNAQVALYQEGEVDYMVATDAIGMGLNMDVDHVAFAGTTKFDGWRHRALEPNELAQIAGRAGRYTADGTFGVTGEAAPLDAETVEHIENHRFKPLSKLMWRNRDLDFFSVERLLASLDAGPNDPDLVRVREAEDQIALRTLWEETDVRDLTRAPKHVEMLWEVCQVPDFRKVSSHEHAMLLARIYHFLRGPGACIPSNWLAGQIERLDRVDGDIDALSKRLAFIRTWTYVANRNSWLSDAAHWQGTTRAIEDRLSDALHERLTQRFVDRRTSVLMRRLKQKERLVAEIDDKGKVTAEGQYLGRLDGFRFTVDESASGDELKTLRTASTSALQAEFARRADKLYLSPDSEIDVTDQGGLMWGADAIGRVSKGDEPLSPKVTVFVDEIAETAVSEKVERRLSHWLDRRIKALFEPMIAMRDDEEITGLARGVAFQLAENFGVIRRREIAQDIKSLAQEERALLRKHGVRFGQHFIFMPALLKPAPTRLRLLLWNLATELEEFAEAPPPGHVTVPADDTLPQGYYEMAGYSRLGGRALRIDMLERLADLLRPMDGRTGFEASQDMLSITGCTLEQFADMMGGLGYRAERGERPKTVHTATDTEAGDSAAADQEAGKEADAAPEAPAAESDAEAHDQVPAADLASDSTDEAVAAPDVAEATGEAPAGLDSEMAAVPEMASVEPEIASAAPELEPAEPEAASAEPQDADSSAEAVPDAESASAAEEAEAQTETFYIFRHAPRGRPNRGPRRDNAQGQERQVRNDGAEGEGRSGGHGRHRRDRKADGEGQAKPPRHDGKARHRDGKGKTGGKPGGKPRKHEDKGPRRISAGPPRKEQAIDPDNPFAILQKLKSD